jgi:hypothetical protein
LDDTQTSWIYRGDHSYTPLHADERSRNGAAVARANAAMNAAWLDGRFILGRQTTFEGGALKHQSPQTFKAKTSEVSYVGAEPEFVLPGLTDVEGISRAMMEKIYAAVRSLRGTVPGMIIDDGGSNGAHVYDATTRCETTTYPRSPRALRCQAREPAGRPSRPRFRIAGARGPAERESSPCSALLVWRLQPNRPTVGPSVLAGLGMKSATGKIGNAEPVPGRIGQMGVLRQVEPS